MEPREIFMVIEQLWQSDGSEVQPMTLDPFREIRLFENVMDAEKFFNERLRQLQQQYESTAEPITLGRVTRFVVVDECKRVRHLITLLPKNLN